MQSTQGAGRCGRQSLGVVTEGQSGMKDKKGQTTPASNHCFVCTVGRRQQLGIEFISDMQVSTLFTRFIEGMNELKVSAPTPIIKEY